MEISRKKLAINQSNVVHSSDPSNESKIDSSSDSFDQPKSNSSSDLSDQSNIEYSSDLFDVSDYSNNSVNIVQSNNENRIDKSSYIFAVGLSSQSMDVKPDNQTFNESSLSPSDIGQNKKRLRNTHFLTVNCGSKSGEMHALC